MLEPSITSTSSAQADGQSCGQVECRIAIYGDAVIREVMRQSAREADDPRFRGHDMRAIPRAGMSTQPPNIDDDAGAALAQHRKAGLHAVKCTVEGYIEDFAPIGVAHLG